MPTKELSEILNDRVARKILQHEYLPSTKEELFAVLRSIPQRHAYEIVLEAARKKIAEEEGEQ